MTEIKNISLVAHDNRKKDLIEWVEWNYETLIPHNLICTGTTGKLVEQALKKKSKNEDFKISVQKLESGPLGGDQQLGAETQRRQARHRREQDGDVWRVKAPMCR